MFWLTAGNRGELSSTTGQLHKARLIQMFLKHNTNNFFSENLSSYFSSHCNCLEGVCGGWEFPEDVAIGAVRRGLDTVRLCVCPREEAAEKSERVRVRECERENWRKGGSAVKSMASTGSHRPTSVYTPEIMWISIRSTVCKPLQSVIHAEKVHQQLWHVHHRLCVGQKSAH